MVTVKFLLVSVVLLTNGGTANSYNYDWPGYETKRHESLQSCEYQKYQNQFSHYSYGVDVANVVQFCIAVEERSA